MSNSISDIISAESIKEVDDLSTDAHVLFDLLTLIVNIQYRNKYNELFDNSGYKGYNSEEQFSKVLADQVSPVDNGLLGY